MSFGRFAPSPTGDPHLGNLRTALVAWLGLAQPDEAVVLDDLLTRFTVPALPRTPWIVG